MRKRSGSGSGCIDVFFIDTYSMTVIISSSLHIKIKYYVIGGEKGVGVLVLLHFVENISSGSQICWD